LDNPSQESSNPGDLSPDSAVALFAQMLDPEAPNGQPGQDGAQPSQQPSKDGQPNGATEQDQNAEEPKPDADETITIEVDGKAVEVKKSELPDLYKNGMRQADYTRKTMQTAEERKAAEAERQKAVQEREAYAQQLTRVQALLEGTLGEQQQINWEQLLQQNPLEFMRQKHLFEQRQAQLADVQRQQQQLQAQQQAEAQRNLETHLKQQAETLLAKLPEWKDPEKAKAGQSAIREYLKTQGYDEQAVSNIADARAVVLAHKAMLYDQMVAKANAAEKKVATAPAKVEQPGNGAAPNVDRRSSAYQRLSKSGSVQDGAAVLASLLS
jgi:hypothetical protein